MDNIRSLIEQQYAYVVSIRRYFHANPELSTLEANTQAKIIGELAELGLFARAAAGTGVIAEIIGSRPGKTVAIRADMDALALTDALDQPYRSSRPGVCHACGHDGHMAMLLGVARVLVASQGDLPGRVRLLFQPSEEYHPGGALELISEGALSGVDAVLGTHLWQPLTVGTIGVIPGPIMASASEFTIIVHGRGGHASMPHQTVDALLTGAQIVAALNTVVGRNVEPQTPAAVSVGVFKAGEACNIIADSAIIKGTVRVFDIALRQYIFGRIEAITKGICQAAGAEYTLELHPGYPPVINDPRAAGVVATAAGETVGEANVIALKPVMAGEDFCYYLDQVPGAFLFVGAGNPEKGIIYPHHHPKFDIDEQALAYGMEVMVRTALKLLV